MFLIEINYFIKKGYKSNESIKTIENEDIVYWTKERISQSQYFQYSVYRFCNKIIKKEKLRTILDIGCGPGIKLIKLIYPLSKEIYGIDQERAIKICKKKYGIYTFFVDDIENPKLELKKKFDLIVSSDVIEHLLNPDNLISYIKKFCHRNTYIIFSTPERDILRGKTCNYSPKEEHIREWNKKELRNYLEWNGFKILHHELMDSFKILINFRNPLSIILKDLISQSSRVKKFKTLKKIKHTQLVLCKLNISKSNLYDFGNISILKEVITYLKDLMKLFLIRYYLILFFMYKIFK